MGMYKSWAYRPYQIPQKLFNYLLPIYGKCGTLTESGIIEETSGNFFFHGSQHDYKEMLKRTEFFRIDENINL